MKKLKKNQGGVGLGSPAQYLIEEGTFEPFFSIESNLPFYGVPANQIGWGQYQRIGKWMHGSGWAYYPSSQGMSGNIRLNIIPVPAVLAGTGGIWEYSTYGVNIHAVAATANSFNWPAGITQMIPASLYNGFVSVNFMLIGDNVNYSWLNPSMCNGDELYLEFSFSAKIEV